MDLNEAIKKHTDWKIKLRSAVAGQASVDAATIAKDNACELGKWLQGEGRNTYGKLPSFAKCSSAHTAFHVEAGKVAVAINAKKYEEAKQMLGLGSKFAETTGTVTAALYALQKESA